MASPANPLQPHVVILGGGFGGLSAAKSLADAPVRVTVIDRRNHHVFTPLLYQVATAGLSPGDIASPIRWILRHQANASVQLANAVRVDVPRRTVVLDDGEVSFDYLIVATGATHAYFGHDEWERVAPGLKTLEDALTIRRKVLLAFERAERETDPVVQRRLLTFAVVGAGPTGVELAGALAEISRHALAHDFRTISPETARILLIEAGPSVLAAYPDNLRAFARRALEKLGVSVWTGSPVSAISPGALKVGSETIEVGTILWAAGVAASPLGASLGVPLDRVGRVIVNPDLTIPGSDRVYVAGDLGSFAGPDGRPLPGVVQVAMQQARHATKNILRTLKNENRAPFVYDDLGIMATIGRNSAVADLGWIRLKGLVAWLAWVFLHVYTLIGFRNRLSVMTQWAFSYVTYQRSVRLITHESQTDND
jgi:NADH dehydrogenase